MLSKRIQQSAQCFHHSRCPTPSRSSNDPKDLKSTRALDVCRRVRAMGTPGGATDSGAIATKATQHNHTLCMTLKRTRPSYAAPYVRQKKYINLCSRVRKNELQAKGAENLLSLRCGSRDLETRITFSPGCEIAYVFNTLWVFK
jgi:hypothetical protein